MEVRQLEGLKSELNKAKEFAQKAEHVANLAERKVQEENLRASQIVSQRVQLNMKLKASLTDASKAAQLALGARSWAQQAHRHAEQLEKATKPQQCLSQSNATWPLPNAVRPRKKGPGAPDFESLASPRNVRSGLSKEEMEIARSGRAGWVYRQNDSLGHGGVITPEVSLQDFSQVARDVERQHVPATMMPRKKRHQEIASQLEKEPPVDSKIKSPPHRPGLHSISRRLAEIYKSQQRGAVTARGRRGDRFHSLGPEAKTAPLKPLRHRGQ